MVEGAVHHLDILADLAGANCDTIYAQTWNPAWGEYKGDSQALVIMGLRKRQPGVFRGRSTNAVGLKDWEQETIRAECELGTLVLNARRLERFPYDATKQRVSTVEGEGEEIPLLQQPKWMNTWLIQQVCGLAGWRRADGDQCRSQPTVGRPHLRRHRKQSGLDSRLKCRSC